MTVNLIHRVIPVFLAACNSNQQKNFTQGTAENKVTVDTTVGNKIIIDEIAGSAYRKRAIGYFVIIGKDNSDYTCIFTKLKTGDKVGIDLSNRKVKLRLTPQKFQMKF